MNPRIRELLILAGFSETYERERINQFAELLLEETLRKQEHLMHDGIDPMHSWPHLKQHFGFKNDENI
jgi:hypothetical protein